MAINLKSCDKKPAGPFLSRLAHDRSGNTLVLVAAALLPLMGIIGGSVDMGRAYLAQSRLQQACDAGVLAARKNLGTQEVLDGNLPASSLDAGARFFNVNYRDGSFGSRGRKFAMALEADHSISGVADVKVPASIMGIFGFQDIDIQVDCHAQLTFAAVDIMMVLDVTGSMRHTNAGDTMSRLDSLKQVIRNFHAQVETSAGSMAKVRYGFVPYATNVNVGHLLQDEWVATNWTYQSREQDGYALGSAGNSYWRNTVTVSGSRTGWLLESTYAATPLSEAEIEAAKESDKDYEQYKCAGSQPADTKVETTTQTGAEYMETQTDPPAVLYVQPEREVENGREYRTVLDGEQCRIEYKESLNYIRDYEKVTAVSQLTENWLYAPIASDVSNWRSETNGCIEERNTYEITDYTNVDLSQALDLDIDTIPTVGNSATQWRPSYPEKIYVRSIDMDGSGDFTVAEVNSKEDFADTGYWWFSACPAPARNLATIDDTELNAYLDTLTPFGATYHDIGMIWGARLISPNGLFASQNSDIPRSRHMIFLTDGQTEPYDLAYGAYGVEGLDRRRWNPASAMTLAETIEARFAFTCEEVKKRNVTVWVIAFGTSLNQTLVDCAGGGRYFEAANAAQLDSAFKKIGVSLGDLRVTK